MSGLKCRNCPKKIFFYQNCTSYHLFRCMITAQTLRLYASHDKVFRLKTNFGQQFSRFRLIASCQKGLTSVFSVRAPV